MSGYRNTYFRATYHTRLIPYRFLRVPITLGCIQL